MNPLETLKTQHDKNSLKYDSNPKNLGLNIVSQCVYILVRI
jgi:hypothetical protein